MKALAIRGKNLASLSSEFEVDFQVEPLASAGLFAITGATGAGKSTLLDALCLALYDATPRLQKATSRNSEVPDTGDLTIPQHDPRTTLRRGAAEGFAEVDFVGNDGASYRARWTVRRARSKADGKLQNSEMSLASLPDGQPLGERRKTETLKLIESKIGLTFDQFTRAVLLAQNDFATFLKADDDVRAELLQTLTGTETFAGISKQAFLRMRDEKDKLAQLEQQRTALAPLLPELRTEKETKLKAQAGALEALEKTRLETENWLRWFEALAKLVSAEKDSHTKAQLARDTQVAAQPRTQTLARIDQVQAARPLLEELTRLSSEIAATTRAANERQGEASQAVKTLADRATALESAGKLVAVAEDAKAKALPGIDAAKSLDTRLAALTPPYELAAKARADADNAHRDTAQEQVDAKQALQRTQTALNAAERWLAEHQDQKTLAEGWQGWEATFGQANAQAGEQTRLVKEIAGFTRQAGEIALALSKAQAGCASRSTEHTDAEKKLATLTTTWQSFDVEAIARNKQQSETRREQLVQGVAIWSEWGRLQQRAAQLDAQKRSQATVVETATKALDELAQQKPHLEQARDAAARAYDLAQLATSKDAQSLRARLQADQPCPVCGALEHPYAEGHSSPADAMLKALQDDRDQHQKALAELLAATAARSTEQKAAATQIGVLDKELAELDRTKADNQSRWASLPIATEALAVADEARMVWFAEQESQLKATLASLKQQEDRYHETTKRRDAAQGALNETQRALELARKSLSALEIEQKTVLQAQESAQQRRVELEKQLETSLDKLDGAFAETTWRHSWAASPEQFIAKCRQDVEAWLTQQKQLAELSGRIQAQKVAETAQAEACAKAEAALKSASEQLQQQEAALKTLRSQRLSMFDGKAVTEIEERLESAIVEAKANQSKALSAHQAASDERTRLEEALRQARALLAKHQLAHDAATSRFNDWLSGFNARSVGAELSVEALRELLAFDAAWIAQERKALQAIDQAVESAAAVVKAHREAREAHEKTRPTELGEDVLKASLEKNRADLSAAGELAATLRAELLADEQRQNQAKGLLTSIAEQEKKTRLWSQLGELIGSADGKKFRNFAQQLTLDILLGYGNRHLETLSRRYRLERVKDTLGLLVIDQDMGDEVRSVHSLSGGESFLLSLALALGLASLSSHRVRVESLFIDEGFGSLDSDSLRVAMDALDTLQAQGRKVGVISHVQEMNERIGVRIQVKRLAGGLSRVSVI